MSHWEPSRGASDEWYTPKYIFDALGVRFDLDVACPPATLGIEAIRRCCVPSEHFIPKDYGGGGLKMPWEGFVWMNPPFGGRNSLKPWLDKFFAHGNGVALTPDRTSAPWWQEAAQKAPAVLFIAGKVRFIRPDGSEGKSPSNGTTLFAAGYSGVLALENARRRGLGYMPPADLNKLSAQVAA